jgi:hypothetical protein
MDELDKYIANKEKASSLQPTDKSSVITVPKQCIFYEKEKVNDEKPIIYDHRLFRYQSQNMQKSQLESQPLGFSNQQTH